MTGWRWTSRLPAAGTYDIDVVLTKGCNNGIYDIDLDGARVLTGYDAFRPGCHRLARETVSLGRHTLTAGEHTVRFVTTGKAPAAGSYRVSLDAFELHRL